MKNFFSNEFLLLQELILRELWRVLEDKSNGKLVNLSCPSKVNSLVYPLY